MNNTVLYMNRTLRNHFWVGGAKGQLKIRDLRIGVAGLGGMGSNIAEIFARLGVGHLRIADPDTIERTNINRQVIANEETVGMTKAKASEIELRKIASDMRLEVFPEGIQENNVEQFVEGMDVIINEIDVFHVDKQIMLLNAARKRNIPAYTTLVVGLGIHLYKYDPRSEYTPTDFLGKLMESPSAEKLLDTLGEPLPIYLQNQERVNFIQQIATGDVPIFGASTYLGQSLLTIRVLYDLGCLGIDADLPKTPCLPEFLVLDPLTFTLRKAKESNGKISYQD